MLTKRKVSHLITENHLIGVDIEPASRHVGLQSLDSHWLLARSLNRLEVQVHHSAIHFLLQENLQDLLIANVFDSKNSRTEAIFDLEEMFDHLQRVTATCPCLKHHRLVERSNTNRHYRVSIV